MERRSLTLGALEGALTLFAGALLVMSVVTVPATPAGAATLRRALTGGGAGAAADGELVSYYDVGVATTGKMDNDNDGGGIGNGDNVVRIINPTRATGSVCAFIYVFDDDQELGECCGCPITPDKLLTLMVKSDLTANWAIRGPDNDDGVIEIIAGPTNVTKGGTASQAANADPLTGNLCDPTVAYTASGNLNATIVHNEGTSGSSVTLKTVGLSVDPFTNDGTPDSTQLSSLLSQCQTDVQSNQGFCDCGPDLGDSD